MSVFKKITQGISQKCGKVGLKIAQSKPEIFFVVGIVGIGVATIELCKKTGEGREIIEEHNNRLDDIQADIDDPEVAYDEEDAKKEKTSIYIQTGVSLVKNYAPGVLLMIGSIGCLGASHHMLRTTIAELGSAYTILEKKFNAAEEKAKRVVGEEKAKEIFHGVETDEIHEVLEDGSVRTTKKKIIDALGEESRFFEPGNVNWRDNPAASKMFLLGIQRQANALFDIRGYMFLNEVYEMLGFPITDYGQVICWIKGEGDDKIDFGLYEDFNTKFMNGEEDVAILTFNHDGAIYKKVTKFNLYNNGSGTRRDIFDFKTPWKKGCLAN